jgi:hypothetical protein
MVLYAGRATPTLAYEGLTEGTKATRPRAGVNGIVDAVLSTGTRSRRVDRALSDLGADLLVPPTLVMPGRNSKLLRRP